MPSAHPSSTHQDMPYLPLADDMLDAWEMDLDGAALADAPAAPSGPVEPHAPAPRRIPALACLAAALLMHLAVVAAVDCRKPPQPSSPPAVLVLSWGLGPGTSPAFPGKGSSPGASMAQGPALAAPHPQRPPVAPLTASAPQASSPSAPLPLPKPVAAPSPARPKATATTPRPAPRRSAPKPTPAVSPQKIEETASAAQKSPEAAPPSPATDAGLGRRAAATGSPEGAGSPWGTGPGRGEVTDAGHRGGGDGGAWDAGRIDTPPRLIRRRDPVYPLMARRQGIQGMVTARVLVGTTGAVQEVVIESATPPEIFEEAVTEALSRWRFSPGRHHGQAVAAWVRVPIRFQLR